MRTTSLPGLTAILIVACTIAACSSAKTTIIDRQPDGSIRKTVVNGVCSPVRTDTLAWEATPVYYRMPDGSSQMVLEITNLSQPISLPSTIDYCTDPLKPAAGTATHKILYRENGMISEVNLATDDKTIEQVSNGVEEILPLLKDLAGGNPDLAGGVIEKRGAKFLVVWSPEYAQFYRQELTREGLQPYPGRLT